MNKILTRGMSLVLILVLAVSMTACGGNKTPETTVETPDTTVNTPDTTDGTPVTDVDNLVTYFSMNMGESYDNMTSLSVYDNGDGTVYVEYVGAEKKVGNFDASLFATLAQKAAELKLADLNGQEVYEDGEASGSMYIEFADSTVLMANFYGSISDEFTAAFTAMDAFFQELTADLPVYVPQAQVVGEVDAEELAAMQEILNNSGMQGLDTMMITAVALDENFGYTVGLSGSEGIASATSCNAMMMTTAFSFVIVTVEDEASIADVRADFENTMDWRKWVCVAPSNALIAQNGNMVLCIMGDGLDGIANAAENSGWTELTVLENPDLQ